MGPLFIREPKIGGNELANQGSQVAALLGQSLTTAPTITWTVLGHQLYDVQEPVLVEQVRYCLRVYSNLAGEILLAARNELYGSSNPHEFLIGGFPVAAGSASPGPRASGVISLGITVPVGWTLLAAHNVADGGGFTYLDITAHGGIVR